MTSFSTQRISNAAPSLHERMDRGCSISNTVNNFLLI